MVVVEFVAMDHEEESRYEVFRLSLAVVGYVPKDFTDVMNFITRWADTLTFDYIWVPGELGRWGYILMELSRGKFLLKMIPLDTYSHECGSRSLCCGVFADEGSPIRHLYFISKNNALNQYEVKGVSIWHLEMIDIDIEFFESSLGFTRCWDDQKEELASKPDIYTGIYCDLRPQMKKLAKMILSRAKFDRRRQEGEVGKTKTTGGTS